MEPIFKVGDKVRIKKRTQPSDDYKYSFADAMAKLAGQIFIIKSVSADHNTKKRPVSDDNALYHLKEDVGNWSWASSMLERVSDSPVVPTPITLSKKRIKLNFKV